MSDEELIENAARALASVHNEGHFERYKTAWLDEARAALAVFREHTAPTDDGRGEAESDEGGARAAAERYLDDQTRGGYLAWPENQIADAMQDFEAGFRAGFRRGAPADREQIAGEIAAEREDTEDGFGFEAYINGLIRAEQIVREGR